MSLETGFSIAKLIYKGVSVSGANSMSGMASLAGNVVWMAKRYVDGENNKLLETVQKSEGCPNIQLVECTFGVPSAYAVTHVHENGGVSWRRPDIGSHLVFWHPDSTFRPSMHSELRVRNKVTGLVGEPKLTGPSKVCEKMEKCCRRPRS